MGSSVNELFMLNSNLLSLIMENSPQLESSLFCDFLLLFKFDILEEVARSSRPSKERLKDT